MKLNQQPSNHSKSGNGLRCVCIVLIDEPANHIDAESVQWLEAHLQQYKGSVIAVAHDRWFLDRVATHILAFEGDSQVYFFEGSHSEYEENKKKRLATSSRIALSIGN